MRMTTTASLKMYVLGGHACMIVRAAINGTHPTPPTDHTRPSVPIQHTTPHQQPDGDDDDEDSDAEEEEKEDEEEEDDEEEDEDDEEAAPFGRRGAHQQQPGRHVKSLKKRPLLARLLPRRLLHPHAGNATAPGGNNATSSRQLLLQATRGLSARRLAGVGLRLALVAALAYAVARVASFKATMQFLMILSVLAEIAGRLGLLKDLKLPLPSFLPSGSTAAAALRAQARGPATFSFELLNDRYQADMARLGLLTGTGSTPGRLGLARPSSSSPVVLGRPAVSTAASAAAQPPRGLDFVRTPAYGGEAAAAAGAATAVEASNANATAPAAAVGNGTVAASHNSTSSSSGGAAPAVKGSSNGPKPRCYVMTIKGDLMLTQGPYLAQAVSFLLGASVGLLLPGACQAVSRLDGPHAHTHTQM